MNSLPRTGGRRSSASLLPVDFGHLRGRRQKSWIKTARYEDNGGDPVAWQRKVHEGGEVAGLIDNVLAAHGGEDKLNKPSGS